MDRFAQLVQDGFGVVAVGAITVPTLVLHGELDRVVPIAFGERLYSAILRFADGARGPRRPGAISAVRDFLAGAPADLN